MRKYIFSDESGDFNFSKNNGASKYFIICTICLDEYSIAHDLLGLRKQLVWDNICENESFHASRDKQVVRDEVFKIIQKHNFRIDATILEKSKSQPQLRTTDHRFYQYAWYYHFKKIAPLICDKNDELFISPASIGTKSEKAIFKNCVKDVITQSVPTVDWRIWFVESKFHPCLQIADYCTWAIQRKWEREDDRSHVLIADKIHTEFDLFRTGETHYY